MRQKVYDEAKQYAMAVLVPYVGQRFWSGSEMFMVCGITKQNKVRLGRVVTGTSPSLWDESITFDDLWHKLNTRVLIPWRGNELRHQANLRSLFR